MARLSGQLSALIIHNLTCRAMFCDPFHTGVQAHEQRALHSYVSSSSSASTVRVREQGEDSPYP